MLLSLCVVALVVCVMIMTDAAWEKKAARTGVCGIVAVVLLALVIAGAAVEKGYGVVEPKTQNLTKRLEKGAAYHLVSSTKDGADQIILVNKTGTSDFYALRVKDVPPEHFTLIHDKPVAIEPPIVTRCC